MPCGTSLSAVPGQTTIPWQQHPPGLRERQGRKAVQGRSASSPFQGPYTRLGNPQAMHYRKPQSLERPLGTVSHCNGQIKPPRPICPERLCRYSWGFLDVSAQRVHLLGRQPDASLDTCQARCCRRGRPERPSYCHGRSFSHAEDFWNSRSRGCLFKTFRNLGSCMQDTDRKAAQRQSSGLRMFGGR